MNITLNNKEEYRTLLNALNAYGNRCLDIWTYTLTKGMKKPDGREFTKQDSKDVKRRSDLCFEIQSRLEATKHESSCSVDEPHAEQTSESDNHPSS